MASYLVQPYVRRHGQATVHTDPVDAGHSVVGRESGYSGRWTGAANGLSNLFIGMHVGDVVQFDTCVVKRLV